jgi:SMODS-associated and fused to various effectors sensor domain/TIR domain
VNPPPLRPLVFINYRGSDDRSAASHIYTRLVNRLSPDAVFLDYESIPPGHDYKPVLLDGVRHSAVLLTLIGERWFTRDSAGRFLLDDPDDWVRKEILEAHSEGIPIAPVLLGINKLAASDLPTGFEFLSDRQYHIVHNQSQNADVEALINKLIRHYPRIRDMASRHATLQRVLTATSVGLGSGVAELDIEMSRDGVESLEMSEPLPVAGPSVAEFPQLDDLATAAGISNDANAIRRATDWILVQTHQGHLRLSRTDVVRAATALGLRDRPARAVLSVATLKPDPMAATADHALDWVDRFDGDSDFVKRRPKPPATWQQLQTDIEAIPHHLPADRPHVLLTGSVRQATAFAVGGALRMVTGIDIAVNQRGQLWSSTTPYAAPLTPTATEHSVDQGNDLAIALAIATDLTTDVLTYLHDQHIPAARLLVLRPASGTCDISIPDPATAVAFTIGVRDTIRTHSNPHRRIHLFLAGPLGIALLLGHRWNCLRPTTVYEDVRRQPRYEPAFTLDA